MTTEAKVLQQLRQLTAEQQQAVLDLIERLARQRSRRTPRKSARGRWGKLKIDVSLEDIRQMRGDIWTGFPREDVG